MTAVLVSRRQDYGWIVAAFSVAYTVGNLVWGRALDRVGPFVGMLAASTVGILLIPMLYVAFQTLREKTQRKSTVTATSHATNFVRRSSTG